MRTKRAGIWVVLFSIAILCLISVAQAQVGLRVAPPVITLRDVSLGENHQVATLAIVNVGEGTHTYAISIDHPVTYREGYDPLPDEGYNQGWVTFDKTSITLGPNEPGEVKVFLEIPNEKQYHAQNWETWINVEGSGGVGVAVAVRLLISTAGEPPTIFDRMIMFIQDEAAMLALIGIITACIIAGIYVFRKKFTLTIGKK